MQREGRTCAQQEWCTAPQAGPSREHSSIGVEQGAFPGCEEVPDNECALADSPKTFSYLEIG